MEHKCQLFPPKYKHLEYSNVKLHLMYSHLLLGDRQEGPDLRLELTDATLTPDPLCSLFVQTADLRSDRDLLQPH